MNQHIFMMEQPGFPFAERDWDYFGWVDMAKGAAVIDARLITAAELRILADWMDKQALTTVVQNGGDNA